MANSGPRVITPAEHTQFFEPALRRLTGKYGCLVVVGPDARSQAKGTAILAEVAGRKIIVTARHVVTHKLFLEGDVYLMLSRLDSAGLHVYGTQLVPSMFVLDVRSPLWQSVALDVAVFPAQPEVCSAPEASFFEGLVHAATLARLRTRWQAYVSENQSLPYYVLGFPNCGHLVDEQTKIEQMSALPLPAYVTQLEAHPWNGHGNHAPQLMLEVDAHDRASVPVDQEDLARVVHRRLSEPHPEAPEPFGGFSGGPVVVIGMDGEHLIGIIREGGTLFGSIRAAATAWDDFITAFTTSQEWALLLRGTA